MNQQCAPYLRMGKGEKSFTLPVLCMLCALIIMAVFLYGPRVLLLCLISCFTAVACEYGYNKLFRTGTTVWDCSALVTGLILACLCPASAPYWMSALGSAFAILFGKMPFGGLGKNLLNPAALGWGLLAVCFPKSFFQYPSLKSYQFLSFGNTPEYTAAPSLAAALKDTALSPQNAFDILLSRISGPLGCTAVLILFACAIFLLQRKLIHPRIPISFLAAVAVISLLFPRSTNLPLFSLIYELSAGSLLFCAVFMATDPVTAPKFHCSQIIYGAGCGVFTMLLRFFGPFEQGAPLALLVMNALAPLLDHTVLWMKNRKKTNRQKPE